MATLACWKRWCPANLSWLTGAQTDPGSCQALIGGPANRILSARALATDRYLRLPSSARANLTVRTQSKAAAGRYRKSRLVARSRPSSLSGLTSLCATSEYNRSRPATCPGPSLASSRRSAWRCAAGTLGQTMMCTVPTSSSSIAKLTPLAALGCCRCVTMPLTRTWSRSFSVWRSSSSVRMPNDPNARHWMWPHVLTESSTRTPSWLSSGGRISQMRWFGATTASRSSFHSRTTGMAPTTLAAVSIAWIESIAISARHRWCGQPAHSSLEDRIQIDRILSPLIGSERGQ